MAHFVGLLGETLDIQCNRARELPSGNVEIKITPKTPTIVVSSSTFSLFWESQAEAPERAKPRPNEAPELGAGGDGSPSEAAPV